MRRTRAGEGARARSSTRWCRAYRPWGRTCRACRTLRACATALVRRDRSRPSTGPATRPQTRGIDGAGRLRVGRRSTMCREDRRGGPFVRRDRDRRRAQRPRRRRSTSRAQGCGPWSWSDGTSSAARARPRSSRPGTARRWVPTCCRCCASRSGATWTSCGGGSSSIRPGRRSTCIRTGRTTTSTTTCRSRWTRRAASPTRRARAACPRGRPRVDG